MLAFSERLGNHFLHWSAEDIPTGSWHDEGQGSNFLMTGMDQEKD